MAPRRDRHRGDGARGQRHVERDAALHRAAGRRARRSATSPASRRWRRSSSRCSPSTTSSCSGGSCRRSPSTPTCPCPRWSPHETDAEWLGSPFLLMRRVDGIVPSDIPPYTMAGWLFDAAPEEQRKLERESVRVLARPARAHARDPRPRVPRPSEVRRDALDQHLDYQRWYYDWAREGQHVPLIERTFAALDTTRPPEGPTVLNWGDSRIGNMMFRDFAPVAVLDWEMAALGPAEIDVALDDLPAPLLRGPDPASYEHAVPGGLPAARARRARSTPRSRARAARPRVVRDVRGAALRHRVDPHDVAHGRVRRGRGTRRSRRRDHVPQPARGDGRPRRGVA